MHESLAQHILCQQPARTRKTASDVIFSQSNTKNVLLPSDSARGVIGKKWPCRERLRQRVTMGKAWFCRVAASRHPASRTILKPHFYLSRHGGSATTHAAVRPSISAPQRCQTACSKRTLLFAVAETISYASIPVFHEYQF